VISIGVIGSVGASATNPFQVNALSKLGLSSQFGLPLAEVGSLPIHQFHLYWQGMRQGDRLPSRSDIEPADIKHLLPHLLLVDLESEPFRVRYRLCGTRVAEMCGDVTGRYLDELDGGSTWSPAVFQQQYEAARRCRSPVFGRDWILTRHGTPYPCLIGIWPLTKNSDDVEMCAAIEDYLELRPDLL
jgi:hypothetical protein